MTAVATVAVTVLRFPRPVVLLVVGLGRIVGLVVGAGSRLTLSIPACIELDTLMQEVAAAARVLSALSAEALAVCIPVLSAAAVVELVGGWTIATVESVTLVFTVSLRTAAAVVSHLAAASVLLSVEAVVEVTCMAVSPISTAALSLVLPSTAACALLLLPLPAAVPVVVVAGIVVNQT